MSGETQAVDAKTDEATLAAFLDDVRKSGQPLNAVSLFHAVRKLPYLSTGDRSLEGILARRAGSCSSKHILLAALLNHVGVKADVELVLGDFATPFRAAQNIPLDFVAAARDGIRDIHNIVRADINGASIVLDATWHDAMLPFDMRVNNTWNGQGNTLVAVDVKQMLGASAEPAEHKARLISSWPEAEQQKRRRFLEAVNDWVASIAT
jgi:hypothetical protein